jgi:hypothetical protein
VCAVCLSKNRPPFHLSAVDENVWILAEDDIIVWLPNGNSRHFFFKQINSGGGDCWLNGLTSFCLIDKFNRTLGVFFRTEQVLEIHCWVPFICIRIFRSWVPFTDVDVVGIGAVKLPGIWGGGTIATSWETSRGKVNPETDRVGEEEEEGKRYKRKKEIGSHKGAIMIYFGWLKPTNERANSPYIALPFPPEKKKIAHATCQRIWR